MKRDVMTQVAIDLIGLGYPTKAVRLDKRTMVVDLLDGRVIESSWFKKDEYADSLAKLVEKCSTSRS